MRTIFLDESGYTGENFLDPEQCAFGLATIALSEKECADLKLAFFSGVN
jgi:hypothetical protein